MFTFPLWNTIMQSFFMYILKLLWPVYPIKSHLPSSLLPVLLILAVVKDSILEVGLQLDEGCRPQWGLCIPHIHKVLPL